MKRVKHFPAAETCVREVLRMSENTKLPPKGSDWTRLLTDPDLVSHLGKLLQTYREVASGTARSGAAAGDARDQRRCRQSPRSTARI